MHAHPDDTTDNMKILVPYLTYAQYVANGSSCAQRLDAVEPVASANGLAKCNKMTGSRSRSTTAGH